MSGAQVVPIFSYTKDKAYLDNLLPQLNGVLFPGGGTAININNIWTKNADYILKYAMEQNKKGNPFPVWGTCLGWELIAYLTSGYDSNVLSPVRGESAVRNRLAIKTPSYLFDDLSASIKLSLQSGVGIVYFNHVYAVSTTYHQNNQIFRDFWNIVSTTTSSYNEVFVSGAESKDYPIYGVQFHPEKNLYEWSVSADRSDNGAEVVQILSNKFVEKARTSKNRFSSPEAFYKASIYNYKTQPTNKGFTAIYLFNEVNSPAPESQQKEPAHLSTE
jgi:gamma-glutamyl hydrolase